MDSPCSHEGTKVLLVEGKDEADLHTYLAWQDEPGTPMGLAITKQALNPNTSTAHEFANWLTRLFDQSISRNV